MPTSARAAERRRRAATAVVCLGLALVPAVVRGQVCRSVQKLSAEQYWTLVSEIEVPSLQAFEDMISGKGASEQDTKEYEKIMDGYHDLVERGRREIFKIEA